MVLAAGLSSRFDGPAVKQLACFEGETLVRRAVRTAAASSLDPLVVVVGHGEGEVRAALQGLDPLLVTNPDYADGQSTSVRSGLEAAIIAGGELDGVLFLPVDQPLLDAGTIDRLIGVFRSLGRQARERALVPTHRGRRGAPVLFGADLFTRLCALERDQGGRRILESSPELAVAVELEREDALVDADTVDDLRQLSKRASRRS